MKNQQPFKWLSKKGVLYAEVRIHDLESGESRVINQAEECKDQEERAAYDECVSTGTVRLIGNSLAEPLGIETPQS